MTAKVYQHPALHPSAYMGLMYAHKMKTGTDSCGRGFMYRPTADQSHALDAYSLVTPLCKLFTRRKQHETTTL